MYRHLYCDQLVPFCQGLDIANYLLSVLSGLWDVEETGLWLGAVCQECSYVLRPNTVYTRLHKLIHIHLEQTNKVLLYWYSIP